MRLKDVMTREVEVIAPDATIREAAARMRALADGRDPDATPIREVMSAGVVTAFEDDDVTEAARLMQREQIRRLPVLDRAKQLVGIVSLGDLAVEAGDDALTGRTLEEISEPAQPER
jgi:CBS domain-containing protein